MRLPVNLFADAPVPKARGAARRLAPALPLIALVLLCASPASAGRKPAEAPLPTTGPAADYPVVIGDPFTIDGKTWTPADTMNYDQVGYAGVAAEGTGVSAAHRTLPLPSYVEVTSLNSGRTILVRLTTRGPMRNDRLIELSPAAAAQLGVTGDSEPIRMRRVNPPEPERAALRSGGQAPARMDTPKSLLGVLMRKLTGAPAAPIAPPIAAPTTAPAAAAAPAPAPRPAAKAKPRPAAPAAVSKAAPAPTPAPAPLRVHTDAVPPIPTAPPASVSPAAAPASGGTMVQVATFSTRERADAAARAIGARVVPAGRLWRMQLGPYADRAQAQAGLAKARAAGYRDARIVARP